MNFSIAIFALLMSAGGNMTDFNINSSTEDVKQNSTVVISEDEEIEMLKPVQELPKEKFKRRKNMISIDPLRGKCTVKVGQQVYYSASVHGSVGYAASANSSDNEALPLNRSFIEYKNKRKAKMSGGDSATKYFIWDVNKVGTYEIIVAHYFRGDLENEFTITINIVEE